MAELRRWYLVTYDIRDDKRWRKAYAILKGWGERLQYSVFRLCLTDRDREKLRWDLARVLDPEDALLFIGLCDSCIERVRAMNPRSQWPDPPAHLRVL
jgi:CRISPR-associated protein Cas2